MSSYQSQVENWGLGIGHSSLPLPPCSLCFRCSPAPPAPLSLCASPTSPGVPFLNKILNKFCIGTMIRQPTLQTQRLTLRPFMLSDAPQVKQLAGAWEIADTTLSIPHPYEDGMAEKWIKTHFCGLKEGSEVIFAVLVGEVNILCGAVGLLIDRENYRAEIGYWIGKPYWGKGYCTEAAREVLRYAFEDLALHRIHSSHFSRNPASGRVMQKIGMTYEGCHRQHILKWGKFEDLEKYGILKSDWQILSKL